MRCHRPGVGRQPGAAAAAISIALAPAAAAVGRVVVVVSAVDKETGMTTNIKTGGWVWLQRQSARRGRLVSAWWACAWALLLALPLPVGAVLAEQQTFATPEAAVGALVDALRADDDAALVSIFGPTHKRLVVSPDRAENTAARAKLLERFDILSVLEVSGAGRRTLLIGDEAWPLPIPLVREQDRWRFATEQGEEELINRRVGANEREAIRVLRAYLDAQRQYAARDRNGDDVLEYAQRLGSTPGKRDGLYWPADADQGEEASPFGPLIASAADYLKGHQLGDAYRGYYFRVLTRQGPSAPGGAFSYLINGRMLAGFALIAYPAEYGVSGVMTFIVSNNGKIYQKNIANGAAQIKAFNPDASWQLVDDRF